MQRLNTLSMPSIPACKREIKQKEENEKDRSAY